jgi:hypothetical protein
MVRIFSGMVWPWVPQFQISSSDAHEERGKPKNLACGAEQQSMVTQQ